MAVDAFLAPEDHIEGEGPSWPMSIDSSFSLFTCPQTGSRLGRAITGSAARLASSGTSFPAFILAIAFTKTQPQRVKNVIGMQIAMKRRNTSVRKNQSPTISGLSAHWKTPLWKKVCCKDAISALSHGAMRESAYTEKRRRQEEKGCDGDGVHRHGLSLRPTGNVLHVDGRSVSMLCKNPADL
jgi:hypothetical protein